jgi:prepilin-type N-terminal cleavage/methylation domain-containing protein
MSARRTTGGFTLIEIMISVAVLAILVVGIYTALASSQTLYATGVTRQEIQDRVRRALNEIARELRQGSAGTLPPTGTGVPIVFATAGSAGDENVNFRICTGFGPAVPPTVPPTPPGPLWSAEILFTTVAGDNELDNGLDDNRNRLVDERKLMRFQNGVPPKLLADNVKEGSVRFTPTMTAGVVDRILVTFTAQGVDSQGRVIEATDSVTVEMRNE